MLQKIRDKSKGIFAAIVIGLLCIPFIFVGVANYATDTPDDSVAIVNGEKISAQDFATRFRSVYRNSLDPSIEDIAKRQLLEAMISQELQFQTAQKIGLEMSPESIRSQIQSVEQFKINGVFNKEIYVEMLKANSLTPRTYEMDIRKNGMSIILNNVMTNSALALPGEIANLQRLQNQTRSFEYLEVSAEEFLEGVSIDDTEIETYYNDFQSDYQNPEMVSIEYIDLDAASLAANIEVDDGTLQGSFESQKNRFTLPERRLSSHILIEVDPGADDETKKAAFDQASSLSERANGGESFADLAKEFSKDLGSANLGGDLGWVERGDMVAPFEAALFSMDTDQISAAVESRFGYHVIQLRGIEEERGKTFEEAKDELATDYRDVQSEREFLELQQSLASITFDDPSGLASAADAVGMDVATTEPFSRVGGEGVAANRAVIDAAFSDEVLLQGLNSDPISIGQNQVVFIRVLEHIDASVKPLDEVREDIIEKLKLDKAKLQAKQKADQWLASLAEDNTLASLAETAEIQLNKIENATRTASGQDLALVREVFKMPSPEVDQEPSAYVVEMTDNRYALVQLNNIQNPTIDDLSEALNQSLSVRISRSAGSEEGNALTESLRGSADIEIFEDRLTVR